MKYNTLQLRYIQRRDKAFDTCPEVRLIQDRGGVFSCPSGYASRKDPGIRWIPHENSFVAFWQTLGADLVRVLSVAYETGQLSTSQRRGLIIVLYKKNDRLDTKNWRPISLLNIDYKIATRTISGCLLAVLSLIIGPDQTCGVPSCTI